MTAFDLPDRLAAKRDPRLIAADEDHFRAIAAALAHSIREVSESLAIERTARGVGGELVERDHAIRRLAARLRTLQRYGLDLTLGRMVTLDGEVTYVGRLGLTGPGGERLLIDWRSPAAEPFFAASHGDPMGLASRRRYRWSGGRISDYWDEAFTVEGLDDATALDDQSAFIASLGDSRSPRMRDVLGTIQADQDAIIRAGSRGALVVDGGPGTGKTVVALHRAAYLVYSDPRLSRRHGGVLFVGPGPAYLSYVADVLPNLGEDGVRLCTLRDLVAEGATAGVEQDPRVAELKNDARMVQAIENAARYHERPPREALEVETELFSVEVEPADWAAAFEAAEPGTPHDEARDEVWAELIAILADRLEDAAAGPDLMADAGLRAAFARAWPLLDPVGVVADLWSSAAFLRTCAPWLGDDDIRRLLREDPRNWTAEDLPLLDAARQRIGDPEAPGRARRAEAALASQRQEMSHVIDHLIQSMELDDGDGVMKMLRQEGMQEALVDGSAVPRVDPDLLAGPFAHIVVDEAQELTDAQWRMLLRRCPSRSFTIVGDRAQARNGFAGTWAERLARAGLRDVSVATLTINYRTPSEVMTAAEPVIRAALPDANVPTSIRDSGIPVAYAALAERDAILAAWLAENEEGLACVIGDPSFPSRARVRSHTPETAKGLEFDLVLLVDPERFSAVDRYVSMTRATQQLIVLTSGVRETMLS